MYYVLKIRVPKENMMRDERETRNQLYASPKFQYFLHNTFQLIVCISNEGSGRMMHLKHRIPIATNVYFLRSHPIFIDIDGKVSRRLVDCTCKVE
jgi:hypothetical protein